MAEQVQKIAAKLRLTIVTRDRKVLETDVDEVVLPGADGALGILPGHTPLLAILGIGELSYRSEGRQRHIAISWGFAEVLPDRVIVLGEGAHLYSEIDRATAERERAEAERAIATLASHDQDYLIAQAKLEEAIAKINISSHSE